MDGVAQQAARARAACFGNGGYANIPESEFSRRQKGPIDTLNRCNAYHAREHCAVRSARIFAQPARHYVFPLQGYARRSLRDAILSAAPESRIAYFQSGMVSWQHPDTREGRLPWRLDDRAPGNDIELPYVA